MQTLLGLQTNSQGPTRRWHGKGGKGDKKLPEASARFLAVP